MNSDQVSQISAALLLIRVGAVIAQINHPAVSLDKS